MRKIKFYFQGENGAFSEEAGFEFFHSDADGVPSKNFEDVIKNVLKDKKAFGILPIENSSIGSIHSNYDLLLKYPVFIIGEINLIVKQHLIGLKNSSLRKIKKIISHPAALQQCQKFLNSLKDVKIDLSYDTAGSVKFIKENNLIDTAAISSEISAKIYDMKILKRNIQDNNKNITRFIVISSKMNLPKRNPKTSIVFTLKNIPGSLFRALSVFALRDIDLTKIESRPIPEKPFEYYFYLDFRGSIDQEVSKNALNNLKEISLFMKVLGSYEEHKVQK
ncbi:MAG: prephenate dehydratase [Ignavibacteria bacterium]